MKRSITLGLLVCLLAISLTPLVIAAQDSNNGPDILLPQDDGKIEIQLEVNCTWTGSPQFIGSFNWGNAEEFPPFSGTQWSYNVVSVTVPYDMKVDIYVTDAFNKGDNFEVYEIDAMIPTTANLIGTTPWVPQDTSDWTNDPNVAWVTPGYSHRMFTWYLTAGTHYFAFRAVASPWGGGTAFVKFCPSNPPVGGNLLPTSSSSISVIALIGAIGTVAVVVGTRKKRAL